MTRAIVTRQDEMVRYCSPFGSPAYMRRERAQGLMERDDRLWCFWKTLGVLSDRMKAYGAPRIVELPK